MIGTTFTFDIDAAMNDIQWCGSNEAEYGGSEGGGGVARQAAINAISDAISSWSNVNTGYANQVGIYQQNRAGIAVAQAALDGNTTLSQEQRDSLQGSLNQASTKMPGIISGLQVAGQSLSLATNRIGLATGHYNQGDYTSAAISAVQALGSITDALNAAQSTSVFQGNVDAQALIQLVQNAAQ